MLSYRSSYRSCVTDIFPVNIVHVHSLPFRSAPQPSTFVQRSDYEVHTHVCVCVYACVDVYACVCVCVCVNIM